MELIPALKMGWLNGWTLLALLYLIFGTLLLTFPKHVVARLYEYDRSSWSKKQRIFYVMGKLSVLVYFVLIVFSPLQIWSAVFVPGIILYGLGLAGFCIALFNFKNAPRDQPVARGLYKISRHAQVLALFVLGCGISIAVGSWVAVFVLILSALFGRSRTQAEEQACLERYGDSYRAYMKRVPRRFFFF